MTDLLRHARQGHGSALLLVGEPGSGKTALLEDARSQASGMQVLAGCGAKTEASMPYAALSELLAPILDLRKRLPAACREALDGVLDLGRPASDRLTVYTATARLLYEYSALGPVLVLIDDAQWIDEASADALRFSARRLLPHAMCMVFAASSFTLSGASTLQLAGVDAEEAAELLGAEAQSCVGPAVADRLCEATGGNPLALVELARLLSPAQLAGAEALPDPVPAGDRVVRAFGVPIVRLPVATQHALLIASADYEGDVATVGSALRQRGLALDALVPAETAGLVSIADGHVEFAHPLLRSVAYHHAAAPLQRDAHAALACALATSPSPGLRRARHVAAATLEPDDQVASEVASLVLSETTRPLPQDVAQALEASARLTGSVAIRTARLLDAARAHHVSGASQRAVHLLDTALEMTDVLEVQADARRLRTHALAMSQAPARTRAALIDEAGRIEAAEPARAAALFVDAATVSIVLGEPREVVRLAKLAWPVARSDETLRAATSLVLGAGQVMLGNARGGYPRIREARRPTRSAEPSIMSCLEVLPMQAELWVGNYGDARADLAALVARIRDDGALMALPYALQTLAWAAFFVGDWSAAESAAREASVRGEAAGQPLMAASPKLVSALVSGSRGRVDDAAEDLLQVERASRRLGVESTLAFTRWVRGELDLAQGRFHEAVEALERAARSWVERGVQEPGVVFWAHDLAEAYIRVNRAADARATLAMLEAQARRTGRLLAHAGAARCRGLLANDADFTRHFEEALAWHELTGHPFERARTELCFGERLRRARRRREAREPLRCAIDAFETLGAQSWAEKARRELRATGERVRRRSPEVIDRLTPQELQVARLVGGGATNREAAASLFVSPRTIESHLNHVYRKLRLRSRVELTRLLGARELP